jgi:hypothetical protein
MQLKMKFVYSLEIFITQEFHKIWIMNNVSHLSGVMVSILAIRPSVSGFKPVRGDGFLKTSTIRSTPSFGGEVKLKAPFSRF